MKFEHLPLTALVFVILALTVYLDGKQPNQESGELLLSDQLLTEEPDLLTFQGKDYSFVLRNADHGWQIQQELNIPVRQDRVTDVIARLRSVQVVAEAEAGSVPESVHGLNSPEARLSLRIGSGVKQTIRFGALNSYNGLRYVALGELERIVMISEKDYRTLKREKEWFVDDRLFPEGDLEVLQVTYQIPDTPNLKLSRIEEQYLVNGKEGDQVFVSEYLKRLLGLRVKRFLDLGDAQSEWAVVGEIHVVAQKARKDVRDRDSSRKPEQAPSVRRLKVWQASIESEGVKTPYYGSFSGLRAPFVLDLSSLRELIPREEALLVAAPLIGENGETP